MSIDTAARDFTIGVFARLLTELGMGGVTVDEDVVLDVLLEEARKKVRTMREQIGDLKRQVLTANAERTQQAQTQEIPWSHRHQVQYLILSNEDEIVHRGDWVPLEEDQAAHRFAERERIMTSSIVPDAELRVERQVRCEVFSLTARQDYRGE